MRSITRERPRCGLPALLLGPLLLTGCASVATHSAAPGMPTASVQSAQEIHIREVFVYQGRVANDLLERVQFDLEPDSPIDPALADAEANMTGRCTYLNQAAVSYLEGSEPGWRLKMKMVATVDACEAAARNVARLLGRRAEAVALSDTAP
jgi:hypothetical protein